MPTLVATCPEETRAALAQELVALGARELRPRFRAIEFEVDMPLAYALHLQLRTASRLLRPIRSVPAHNAAMLYSQAVRIRWHELFDARHGFVVECTGIESGALPARQVITQVREAVRADFTRAGGRVPAIDREEPKVVIVAHLDGRGRCALAFDTSGKALHKRGYRESGHPAPLKETLAAAILLLAGYDGTQVFLDPMCGSGTLAIEAAMIAVNKAPQVHRRKGEFHLEWLADFDRALWRETQERVRAAKRDAPLAPLYASDIESRYVDMARSSALDARVERYVEFSQRPIQELIAPAGQGLLVANLPYGERIGDGDLAGLYAAIGDVLKQRFAGWRAALLAAEDSPWKAIGLRPSRSIPLTNGSIPCRLLIYELYAGTRRRASSATERDSVSSDRGAAGGSP